MQMKILGSIGILSWFYLVSLSFGANLAPHEAYYTMDLVKQENSIDIISDVRGMMLINHEMTCEGWTSVERLQMQVKFKNSRTVLQNLQFSGWESDDGRLYRFASQGRTPLKTYKIRGFAKISLGDSKVNYLIPKKFSSKLPMDTKFPIGFIAHVLDQAKAGEKNIHLHFFDGTDLNGPEWVKILVLGPSKAKVSKDLKNESLLSGIGYKMRITSFSIKKNLSDPLYSYDAVFLENGIMVGAILEFEGFKVLQSLKMIKPFEHPVC